MTPTIEKRRSIYGGVPFWGFQSGSFFIYFDNPEDAIDGAEAYEMNPASWPREPLYMFDANELIVH